MSDNTERLAAALADKAGVEQSAVADVLATLAAVGMAIVVPTNGSRDWVTGWSVAATSRRPVEDAFAKLTHV